MTSTLHPPAAPQPSYVSGPSYAPPVHPDATDYLRRIHWWVRLIGVLVLVSLAFAFVGGFAVGFANAMNGGYSSYSECMADPDTTASQCDGYFR